MIVGIVQSTTISTVYWWQHGTFIFD